MSNSNPAPLVNTGPINASAIRSAQLQRKGGRVNTKGRTGRRSWMRRAGIYILVA